MDGDGAFPFSSKMSKRTIPSHPLPYMYFSPLYTVRYLVTTSPSPSPRLSPHSRTARDIPPSMTINGSSSTT